MPLSDRELIEACLRGDSAAWEDLVRGVIPAISIGKRKFRIMKRLETLPEYKRFQDLLRD